VSHLDGSNASSPPPALNLLISRVAAGDQLAMTSLYDTSSRVLYGFLLRILNEHALAEEVLLDVYVQVWQQAGSYDEVRGSPMAWMLAIARSRAFDRLRAGRQELLRRESFEGFEENARAETDVEETAAISEVQGKVRDALETLPAEQKEVIELAYYGGLSHRAVLIPKPLRIVSGRPVADAPLDSQGRDHIAP
jgi:RNA polymerase sigma-70 factor, ECF subfamily